MKELIISEIIVFIHDYDISLTENSKCKARIMLNEVISNLQIWNIFYILFLIQQFLHSLSLKIQFASYLRKFELKWWCRIKFDQNRNVNCPHLTRHLRYEIECMEIYVVFSTMYIFYISGSGWEREYYCEWRVREIYSSILQKTTSAWCWVSI